MFAKAKALEPQVQRFFAVFFAAGFEDLATECLAGLAFTLFAGFAFDAFCGACLAVFFAASFGAGFAAGLGCGLTAAFAGAGLPFAGGAG